MSQRQPTWVAGHLEVVAPGIGTFVDEGAHLDLPSSGGPQVTLKPIFRGSSQCLKAWRYLGGPDSLSWELAEHPYLVEYLVGACETAQSE